MLSAARPFQSAEMARPRLLARSGEQPLREREDPSGFRGPPASRAPLVADLRHIEAGGLPMFRHEPTQRVEQA
jgi:hypothetical protein